MEPVVFTASYESLIRALGGKLDARAKERFREHGVDLDKSLQAAYPLATWVKSLELACELLAPGKTRDEATHVVGTRIISSFTETTVGRALFALLRIMGPHRGLERMRRSLRMSNNYSETTLTRGADGTYELWCNLVTFPHYYRGLFETGLSSLGAKEVSVTVVAHDEKGARFKLSFR